MSMYPFVEDVQRAVARLFPAFARCAVLPVSETCTTPFAEELDAVATAVAARRQEFVCGRACAHAALQALGVRDAAILRAAAREPVWPAGVVGSISHTPGIAAAVVCRTTDALAVGLDLERADAVLDEGMRRLVLTPAEIVQVDTMRAVETRAGVLIFSAKECVYKIVAPMWGHKLNHQDVEVSLDTKADRFTATFAAPLETGASLTGEPSSRGLRGSFSFVGDHVATGICLERAAAARGQKKSNPMSVP